MSILNSLSHTLLSAQLRFFHSGPLPSLSSARSGGGGWDSDSDPSGPEVVGGNPATGGSSGGSGFGGSGSAGGGGGGGKGVKGLGISPLDQDPLQIDPYYLPEQAPITRPAVPAVKPDSTWLESMGIGQGVASAIWWMLGTLLVLAFIIAVVVWVVRRRDGRGQDSHGPAIVVYAAVGMGALWSLILWGFSRT